MHASVGTAHPQLMAPPPGVAVLRSDSLVAWVLPYGARLMQLFWLKAPEGVRPLSLGFADPHSYRSDSMSIGAVCGRYANRIASARIQRGTTEYILDANHPLGHCIHGGRAGWGQRDWQLGQHDAASVELMLDSADGDMGFPGRCQVRVQYRLQGARLLWQADVTVDRECPINLVQHSYWNLDASPNLLGHRLQVEADTYHPVDDQELPLPARPVAGTCFDFRAAAPISDACVDHLDGAMVLRPGKESLRPVARLQAGGLVMQLRTDRPLLHVYASANLGASATPLGVAHGPGAALCLETEDMPNGPALGSDVWYGPTRDYTHTMAFDFSPAN
jgi:aldose 1-epimerase